MLASQPILGESDARRRVAIFFAGLFAILVASRLCHINILWSDEDYHLAAALQILHGKALYRDLWYDKPPLNAYAYLLFGAASAAVLRVASAIYALAVCASAFHFARRLWSDREGYVAAGLAAFSLIFYFAPATITLEPDTFLILPHLWAVYFARQRRMFLAGLVAGFAMLFHVKALFVLAACAAVGLGVASGAGEAAALLWLLAGFAIPNAVGMTWLAATGAFAGYIEQVWRWGFLYAGSPSSIGVGIERVGNWAAFHAALAIGALYCWIREPAGRWKWIVWTFVAFAAAAIGWRFPPRYFDQLLPPLILAASRGMTLAYSQRQRALQALLVFALLVPVVRFGPRYAILASEDLRGAPHNWSDTAMDRDSQAAARLIEQNAHSGDTLFVWGYRPNLYVYAKLAAAVRFWDSQPLTGVAADRHLVDDQPILVQSTLAGDAGAWAAANRAELARSKPDVIADGLSLYNPRLDMHRYPELAQWLTGYCEVGRTAGTIVYRRCEAR